MAYRSSTPTRKDQLRETLKQHPDGLTVPQIEQILNVPSGLLSSVPQFTSGVYISHYLKSHIRGKPAAVWKLWPGPGPIPADAPRPEKKWLPRV